MLLNSEAFISHFENLNNPVQVESYYKIMHDMHNIKLLPNEFNICCKDIEKYCSKKNDINDGMQNYLHRA